MKEKKPGAGLGAPVKKTGVPEALFQCTNNSDPSIDLRPVRKMPS